MSNTDDLKELDVTIADDEIEFVEDGVTQTEAEDENVNVEPSNEELPNEELALEEITEAPIKAPKKRTTSDYVRYAILAIALFVFIFASYKIIKIFMNYKTGDKYYNEVEEEVFATKADSQSPTILVNSDSYDEVIDKQEGYQFLDYDHSALVAKNKDAQGYLDMPALGVRVPIAHCDNNTLYLNHTIDKRYHEYGCPFIDYRISEGIKSRNPIIYGHAMKNGAMFGYLRKYLSSDFYKEGSNRFFYLYCEEGIYIYEIFSVYVTDSTDSNTYVFNYNSDQAYADYVAAVKRRSKYNTGVSVTGQDKIITLSTCYEPEGKRVIVHAKRL